eukprot:g59681.t1
MQESGLSHILTVEKYKGGVKKRNGRPEVGIAFALVSVVFLVSVSHLSGQLPLQESTDLKHTGPGTFKRQNR